MPTFETTCDFEMVTCALPAAMMPVELLRTVVRMMLTCGLFAPGVIQIPIWLGLLLKPKMLQSAIVTLLALPMRTPMSPKGAMLRMFRFCSVTSMPAPEMEIAVPLLPTRLPSCPGRARMPTDLFTDTRLVLKFGESSIQLPPPASTAASAAGSRRHGAGRVHAFMSLPLTERYARKIA